MADFLDMRTVLIGYAFSACICLAVVTPVWVNNHKHAPEIGFWLADYMLQVVALILIVLHGIVPDVLSAVVGNTLVIGGTVLLYIGMRRYVGRAGGTQVHNYAMLVVFVVAQVYFTFARPDLGARNANISLGLLFICVQAAWLMLRQVGPELRDATRGVGLVMVAYSVLSLVRLFADLAAPGAIDVFHSGLFDTAVVLSYQLLFVALTFGLLLMVNRRLVTDLESDIIVRENAEARLRMLSDHDPLTGLLNSRAFQAAATEKLAKVGISHASLIYLDLDVLKETNDTYGHPMGDRAIVLLADALRGTFRESDALGRMGGDEFAVLTVSREAAVHETLTARLEKEMDRENDAQGLPFRVSASLGIASWDAGTGAPDLAGLIKVADDRMYEAKRKRRFLEDRAGRRLSDPSI